MTPKKNVGHSIRQRLLNYAKSSGQDFNQVLLRFANERLLYRLGKSAYADRFLLKGATLFLVWNESKPHRPTRDVDLMGFGSEDAEELSKTFAGLCSMAEEDGMEYDAGTIEVNAIREDQRYGGLRRHQVEWMQAFDADFFALPQDNSKPFIATIQITGVAAEENDKGGK